MKEIHEAMGRLRRMRAGQAYMEIYPDTRPGEDPRERDVRAVIDSIIDPTPLTAVLQGAFAAEIAAARMQDCPYSCGSDWNWAWRTGFDLGRRIDSLLTENQAIREACCALYGQGGEKCRAAEAGFRELLNELGLDHTGERKDEANDS